MKALWLGPWFLCPYYESACEIVQCDSLGDVANNAEGASLALCMNGANSSFLWLGMVNECRDRGIPVCWMTCEDPNGYLGFVEEAKAADFVFTFCRTMISHYRRDLGHDKVWWLPLAASESLHRPAPLADDPADLVLLGNHYAHWPAKVWFLDRVLRPLLAVGRSLALHTYPTNEWPPDIAAMNRGATSCFDVAKFYPEGRVAVGASCQAGAGIDDFAGTTMTSQRTFETLACGKPYLTVHSDAYAPLGFVNDVHLCWLNQGDDPGFAPMEAFERLAYGDGEKIAATGHDFVLQHHTYAHRLQRIVDAMDGTAKPEELE